jgi:hypothetical protein
MAVTEFRPRTLLTHCRRGHELTEANMYDGTRQCRTCTKMRRDGTVPDVSGYQFRYVNDALQRCRDGRWEEFVRVEHTYEYHVPVRDDRWCEPVVHSAWIWRAIPE